MTSETDQQPTSAAPPAAPLTLQQRLLEARGAPHQATHRAAGASNGAVSGVDGTLQDDLWRSRQAQADRPRADSAFTSRPLQIDSLQSFILNQVPYGITTIEQVRDEVRYDGPSLPDSVRVPDRAQRPPLYWYFDGDAHKIVRALTLTYTYQLKDASGLYTVAPDEIYIGFEGCYDAHGKYEPAGNESPPVLRESDPTRQARSVAVPLTLAHGQTKLDDWLTAELSSLGMHDFKNKQTGWVDFAGPAREATSTRPFAMSIVQLVENQDEFNKLLFWHVGGRPQRVNKAMRIQVFDGSNCLRSILVGYQGAIGTGPG